MHNDTIYVALYSIGGNIIIPELGQLPKVALFPVIVPLHSFRYFLVINLDSVEEIPVIFDHLFFSVYIMLFLSEF